MLPFDGHGGTVFILGGGASLRGFDFGRLRGRHVIAINALGHDAPFADILYFRDRLWLKDASNLALVSNWSGMVVTECRHNSIPDHVHRIAAQPMEHFTVNRSPIKGGRSSGHTAVGLAVGVGFKTLMLLGFDCRLVDGRSHSHDRYRAADPSLYRNAFLPAWRGWRGAAERIGARIINATPGSAIDEFERAAVEEVLA